MLLYLILVAELMTTRPIAILRAPLTHARKQKGYTWHALHLSSVRRR